MQGPLLTEQRPTTSFQYDAVSNLTQLTDPENNDTTWVYDGLNRVTSETNEHNDARSYEYDAASNVTKLTDRNERVIEYSYDNLYQNTQVLWKTGATTDNTLAFAYNAAGALTSAA